MTTSRSVSTLCWEPGRQVCQACGLRDDVMTIDGPANDRPPNCAVDVRAPEGLRLIGLGESYSGSLESSVSTVAPSWTSTIPDPDIDRRQRNLKLGGGSRRPATVRH